MVVDAKNVMPIDTLPLWNGVQFTGVREDGSPVNCVLKRVVDQRGLRWEVQPLVLEARLVKITGWVQGTLQRPTGSNSRILV